MTTIESDPDVDAVYENIDLPRPDSISAATSIATIQTIVSHRSLPSVADSGRISFGAGFRIALQR